MSLILKWLHKNEGLVHMSTMLLTFYGVPTAVLAVFYPNLVEPLVNSAIIGLALISLLYVSYKTASFATEWIKRAVTQATLDEIRDLSLRNSKSDPTVDLESSNVLAVNNVTDETRDAVENLKSAASETAIEPVPVEKKKRAPRAKTVKKES